MKKIEDLLKITALEPELEKDNLPLYQSSIDLAQKDLDNALIKYAKELEYLTPMYSPLMEKAYVREDVSIEQNTDKLLKCSSTVEKRYYLVPKFL